MLALGELTPQQFFAGLYAHPSLKADPMSGGRQMGGHFLTHSLDKNGDFKNLTELKEKVDKKSNKPIFILLFITKTLWF